MTQKTPQGLARTTSPEGLLFVYLEAGSVAEPDLNDWYDNEHIPLRLPVPGVKSAVRYKAVDSQTPTWLAFYNLETSEIADSEAFTGLQARASDKEKTIFQNIGGLGRRVYTHIETFTHPDTTVEALPCKFLLVVGLGPKTPEEEDDLNKWYNEEHMDLLSKIPGWKQGRRYKLRDFSQKGLMEANPVFKYLAVHEFTENNFLASPEFKHATSTEWRSRVMKNAGRKARVFELHKAFEKPTGQ
ncbi:hypothetical protein K438DRAFT_1623624 [Mycena galopus ATCC 62051]|nr:hypothetical protein K438DRAFT_1623624 [Mycena galopus ATCC 62051]